MRHCKVQYDKKCLEYVIQRGTFKVQGSTIIPHSFILPLFRYPTNPIAFVSPRTVCSTTLWIGHLSKLVQQEELSDTFAKYGDIVSIDMIHPRGCAFIVMHRRQDAFKAIGGLKNHKLHGRAITLSWAAGRGVKSKEWKDYWDLDLGVSYIPWSKITENTDFEQLEEGGMFDKDTMPEWLTEK